MSVEGIGDRLRAAAFAEFQAMEAFKWAAQTFEKEAPAGLVKDWLELADQEAKHMQWLLVRMEELGAKPDEKPVSILLWNSLMKTKTPYEFAKFMASAEERGRLAGEKFHQALMKIDPVSAEIFLKIAQEEAVHITLVSKYF